MKIFLMIVSVVVIAICLYQDDPEESNPFSNKLALFSNRKQRGFNTIYTKITAVAVAVLLAAVYVGGLL